MGSPLSTGTGETFERFRWRQIITIMMEKILVNMVQKALAKQQAAENQIVIENNNRLKTRDIEDESNQSNPDKTEGEGEEGTSSGGSDPGGKGGGEKVKIEEELQEEKFPWRKPLVEGAKLRWQKKLVEVCENETVAKKLLETRQKWRGNIIAEMGEDGVWKAEHILGAIDQEHAKLISGSEDELEVEALSRITEDTRWKINLYSAKPNSLPLTIKLTDECASEDLASIFTRFGKQWQLAAAASAPSMEVWRADCLAGCTQKWQANLVLNCSWEAQARAVANVKEETLGIALSKVAQSQEWKLAVLVDCADWQVDFVLGEERQKVAQLIARFESRERVEDLLACKSLEEWKINIFSKDLDDCKYKTLKEMEDWKYQMLLKVEDEEKALCIERQRSQTICELVEASEESWRLNIMLRNAKRDELWRMRLVAPLESEWQVKMVFFAPEVWKAKMIARLAANQEMRARELLECSTEVFAKEVMAGFTDVYYT